MRRRANRARNHVNGTTPEVDLVLLKLVSAYLLQFSWDLGPAVEPRYVVSIVKWGRPSSFGGVHGGESGMIDTITTVDFGLVEDSAFE